MTATVPTISEELIGQLRSGLSGDVTTPGDNSYDASRAVWNGNIDKRPAAIAYCTGVADVIQAVNVARSAGIATVVRSGGHSMGGKSVCDGGLVIDLSRMRGIRVSPGDETVTCQAGVLWGELDRECQAFGLAVPGGVISHTGVAGLTLGGGLGWLNRRDGLSCDNVISVDMVTASGEFVTASTAENSDLFWGLMGGGALLGVVTSFHFKARPVGPVYAGFYFYNLEHLSKHTPIIHEWASTAPRDLGSVIAIAPAPPEPFVDEAHHQQPVLIMAFAWFGDPAAGETLLEPIRDLGGRVGAFEATMAYTDWQSALDADWPHGTNHYIKSSFVNEFTSDVAEILEKQMMVRPTLSCQIGTHQLGGAVRDVTQDVNAFPHRKAEWAINLHGLWTDQPDGEGLVRSWARETYALLEPHLTGSVYVNFVGDDENHASQRSYSDSWTRLRELKKTYDPTNVFRLS